MKVYVLKQEQIQSLNDCTGCSGLHMIRGYSNNGSCECHFGNDPGGSHCECSFDSLYSRNPKKDRWNCLYLDIELNTGVKPIRSIKCINATHMLPK